MNNNIRGIKSSLSLDLWFIRLRWIACAVSVILIVITVKVLHYLTNSNFLPLIILTTLLAATNLIYFYLIKKEKFIKDIKEMQIVSDLLILTFMLHYSGGIENPLSFVYLFHVILSGILLEKKRSYMVVALAFFLYSSLALCELTNIIPHYTLNIFPHTESEVLNQIKTDMNDHHSSPDELIHASHYPPYVWSIIALNFFLMLLTAYFITNIMEQLRSQEKRTREERQRLEHVLKATNAGLVILNKNLDIVWYNEPLKSLLGIKADENETIYNTIFNWIDRSEDAAAKTLNDGIIRSVESEKVDEKGQIQYFQVTVAPLVDAKGEIYQVVELIQDISEKKIIEAEILHTAKMVTLGTMAASIAHEVGNPLASISTRLTLLESDSEPSFISRSVKLLQKEISRIDRIVRGISQFGRSSKEIWGYFNINQILKESIEMLKYHKTAKLCSIEPNLSQNLPEILGVSDQLKQVFLNIGLNALEAMPDGGKLSVVSYSEKGNLVIKFTDTGIGIEEDMLEEIFQPFYSTKEKGSGLGLFIVKHFINAHSGQIEVESKPGIGTTFTLRLPVHRFYTQNKKTDA